MCKGSFYKLGLGKPIKSSSASGIYEGRIPLCFLRGIADLLSGKMSNDLDSLITNPVCTLVFLIPH